MAENGRVWLSVKQAASYLGMSEEWLRERRYRKLPPPFYRMGGVVRYVQSELDAWIAGTRGP